MEHTLALLHIAPFPSYRQHCNQESQNLAEDKFLSEEKSENLKVVRPPENAHGCQIMI